MDVVRVGLSIRALRRRRGWTQATLGQRSGCSGSMISRIERGALAGVALVHVERVLAAMGARLILRVLWQGEELDRLLDRDHATMVDRLAKLLVMHDWVVVPEATFNVHGERGSIDILAWHAQARVMLVVEVKSVVPDLQATLSGLDRKVRLAPVLARERGWDGRGVARLLALPDDRTARRRVEAFGATFDVALPKRTSAVKRWLARPDDTIAGLLFLSDLPAVQARHRVRRPPAVPTLGHRSGA